jgi:ATP-dependent Lon protease
MNNFLIPTILMHNIPLLGLEEQIISIHKELSILSIEYSLEKCDGHIALTLDFEKKNKNNETVYGGVLCKILNKFSENRENKTYIKVLLSIKSRIIINTFDDTSYKNSFLKCISLRENPSDNLDYIEENILKFNNNKINYNINISESKQEIDMLTELLMQKFKNYLQIYGSVQLYNIINDIEDNSKKIDRVAYEFQMTNEELFGMITEFSLSKRIQIVTELINKSILKHQLSKTIDEQVRDQVEKTQKIYLLTEKAKIINKELESLNGEISDIDGLEKKLEELNIKDEIKKKLSSEIRRLKFMNSSSSDAAVIRNYLDWCLNIPWEKYSDLKKNFSTVYDELNREHYGMEKIKERILEYLAVNFRNGSTSKSALLLIGPPGVGKTSLSRKIASSLGRQFARISLGGVRDEADIRGHRRTYLGSMPGKIIQAIRDSGTMNPVILFDEIDKIGNDFRGDPAAALLEVLDREQNKDFLDHYLDIPFDLSQVLFICTANGFENITRPLLDRVEIIQLSSYSDDEKFKIAIDYMIPKQEKEHGLKNDEIIFKDDAIQTIISRYTYEAGVRGLEEQISILMRKTLLKIINENVNTPIEISNQNLQEFLGLPKYLREEKKIPTIGVVHGLAWNQLGGDVLMIESVAIPNDTKNYTGSIKYTGKLGEVMQESIQAAFSYIKSCRDKLGIKENDYKGVDIHIHVPEGGTPKDGPSAGITIFTVLVSLLTQKKVRADVAMTGEITLRGRVLAIGGLKEKILAAKRNGITRIIIPKENERELNEIPKTLKENIEIFMIEEAIDVLKYVLIEEDQIVENQSHKIKKLSKKL